MPRLIRFGLKYLTNFKGRSSRLEHGCVFVFTYGFMYAAALPLQFIDPIHLNSSETSPRSPTGLYVMTICFLFVCGFLIFAVAARRSQDRGWSGKWFQLMFYLNLTLPVLAVVYVFIPSSSLTALIAILVLLIGVSVLCSFSLIFVRTDPHTNKYGPNPHEVPQ
ncbi:MAG: DUF805 domain-containing protein [Planktomarina sp.]